MNSFDFTELEDELFEIQKQAFDIQGEWTEKVGIPSGYYELDLDVYSVLPLRVQVMLDLTIMDAEIQNGGIDQWIFNPGGARVEEAIDALRKLGAQKVLEIIIEVRNQFPNHTVPHSKRLRDYFCRRDSSMREEFERLSKVYYDLLENSEDNLYRILVDYWNHSEKNN